MTDAGKELLEAARYAAERFGMWKAPTANMYGALERLKEAVKAADGEAATGGYAGVKDAEVNNQGGEPEDWRPVDAEEAARLRSVIYRLLERHDASPEVLSIVGSLFDTLPVSDCIDIAEDWLSSGEIMSGEQ